MKLVLTRRLEYPEAVRDEFDQLVAALQLGLAVEHDAEGRQRSLWQRWNLGENLSVAGGGAVVTLPCRLPDALNTGDLVLDPVGGSVTVVTPGVYSVIGQIRWATNGTGIRGAQILRNQMAYADTQVTATGGGIDTQMQVVASFPCVAGTTIALAGYQTSGGALNANAKSGTTHETCLTITRTA